MIATYNATKPGKMLNIREAPGGNVIDKLADGQTVPVDVVERGWCKLDNGYADARFLVITAEDAEAVDDGEDVAETGGSETPETGGSDNDAANGDANDSNPNPEGGDGDGQTAEPSDEDADELRKMTNKKLYELAKGSGIKVKANMSKDALIEAILAGADD